MKKTRDIYLVEADKDISQDEYSFGMIAHYIGSLKAQASNTNSSM